MSNESYEVRDGSALTDLLSEKDLNRLRAVVKKVHYFYFPEHMGAKWINAEVDKFINQTISHDSVEQLMKDMTDASTS